MQTSEIRILFLTSLETDVIVEMCLFCFAASTLISPSAKIPKIFLPQALPSFVPIAKLVFVI